MIWIQNNWFHKFFSFYMAAVVDIVDKCGVKNKVPCRNLTNKSNVYVALYTYI